MAHTDTYFDLMDAFVQDGCPVCRLALAAVHHSIESVNYEFVNDPGFRKQTRAAYGFCNFHAYQWLRQAHPLGTALIYDEVLSIITEPLHGLTFRRSSILGGLTTLLNARNGENGGERPLLEPSGVCPACRVLADQTEMLVATLVESIHEPAFREAYAASASLCLPHLRDALRAAPDEAAFATLRDVAVAGQEQLMSQLREIIRKHDYRFRDEPSGEERGATTRAVEHVIGAKGVD